MDVLSSRTGDARRPRVRRAFPSTLAVGVALVLLAAGQAAAVARTPALPGDVALRVPLENYFFSAAPDGQAVQFELRNDGDRTVRVLDVGADLPGLELVDVAAAGEPLGFRTAGGGPDDLPAFDLRPGTAVVLTLVYRAADCAAVPQQDVPVPVSAGAGRARGTVAVRLPQLPDDRLGAGPEDLAPWQVALVGGECA